MMNAYKLKTSLALCDLFLTGAPIRLAELKTAVR